MIKALHYAIIVVLLGEALYAGFVVFVVLQPAGSAGPLLFDAATVSLDTLVKRRMYAIEGWLAFVGLCIYLGVTEVGPRLAADRANGTLPP